MKTYSIFSKEVQFFCSLPAVIWQVFFIAIPIIVISYSSVHDSTAWLGFSFAHYRNLISLTYFKIIARSLIISIVTAVAALFCAYPVAYFLALRVKRFKNTLLFLLTLPFWVNVLVQIYAWYFLLERNGIINTLLLRLHIIREPLTLVQSQLAIFVVMVYCYLPFIIMPIYSSLEKIDMRLLEASADLGATSWQTFWYIVVPHSMSGIKTGLLLVLIPAFGDFVIPSLLGGSKYMFVGSLISYHFLTPGNTAIGGAFTWMSGIMLGFLLVVIFGGAKLWLLRRRF